MIGIIVYNWIEWSKWAKYRVVESILIWVIYLVAFGRNKASLTYGRNTYRYYIDYTYILYVLKKYTQTMLTEAT